MSENQTLREESDCSFGDKLDKILENVQSSQNANIFDGVTRDEQ